MRSSPVMHYRTGLFSRLGVAERICSGDPSLSQPSRGIALDYDERTMADVKRAFPELDARVGDVEKIDLPDGSISKYLSPVFRNI